MAPAVLAVELQDHILVVGSPVVDTQVEDEGILEQNLVEIQAGSQVGSQAAFLAVVGLQVEVVVPVVDQDSQLADS